MGSRVDVHLERVIERESPDCLEPFKIKNVFESICFHGLLQGLLVDRDYRILDGSYRLAAIKKLRREMPGEFDYMFPGQLVPVNRLEMDGQVELALEPLSAEQTPCVSGAMKCRLSLTSGIWSETSTSPPTAARLQVAP